MHLGRAFCMHWSHQVQLVAISFLGGRAWGAQCELSCDAATPPGQHVQTSLSQTGTALSWMHDAWRCPCLNETSSDRMDQEQGKGQFENEAVLPRNPPSVHKHYSGSLGKGQASSEAGAERLHGLGYREAEPGESGVMSQGRHWGCSAHGQRRTRGF